MHSRCLFERGATVILAASSRDLRIKQWKAEGENIPDRVIAGISLILAAGKCEK